MALNVDIDVTVSKDASGAIDRGTKKFLRDGADRGFAHSQELVPEDRGTLRQSGFQPTWDSEGNLRYGYRAEHAPYMEFGTDAYWPPIGPLRDWAERVSGDPGLAYYVQQKIASDGIDAQPYLRPAARKQQQWYSSREIGNYIESEL